MTPKPALRQSIAYDARNGPIELASQAAVAHYGISQQAAGGSELMAYFFKLRDFEKRFDTMGVDELKRWLVYWTQHAQHLAPKVRKIAMKRVYKVEKAIERRSRDESD